MAGPKVPTPDEIEWMQRHADDSLVPDIIAACSILSVAATVFVGLRLFSRRLLYGYLKLYLNDWLVLVAWCLYVPFIVSFCLSTRYGAGRHVIYATNSRLLQIFNLTNENLYAVVLVLLKWSVILLYRQLFNRAGAVWFHRLTWAVAALATALGLQILITTNLQCIPIAITWDPSIPGKCFDYGKSATVAYAVNAVTELTLLIMPIPLVTHLQVSKQKKWMLYLIFSAGAGTCVISLVQFKYIPKLGQTSDPTWDDIPSGLLTTVEMALGFLATSIPTYRPLYQFIFKETTHYGPATPRYLVSKKTDKLRNTGRSNTSDINLEYAAGGYSMSASGGIPDRHKDASRTMGNGIVVTDQVELVRHNLVNGSWIRVDD